MLTLGRFENRAGELDVNGASQDALDCLANTVAPEFHSIWKLFGWGGGRVSLSDVVAALLHEPERIMAQLVGQCCGGFERDTILFLWRSVT